METSKRDNPNFQVINGTSLPSKFTSSDNLTLCYKNQLMEDPILMDPLSLFMGYDSIHAITFSYNLHLINKLMGNYQDGEIIIGAPFLARKDLTLQKYTAAVLSNAQDAVKQLRSCDRLCSLASEGNFKFRTPKRILDHRKLYILKADNGNTRVISSSANLSTTFITGDRMEHYEYDDSPLAYEWFMREFNTMWENSSDILDSMLIGKETESPEENNPILREAREVDKIVMLKQPEEHPEDRDLIRYDIEKNKADEEWDTLVTGVTKGMRNGLIKFTPKVLEKIQINQARADIRKKVNFVIKEEPYPALKIDTDNSKILLNGKELDLNPSADELNEGIQHLLELFGNLEDFIDRNNRLQLLHYKAMVLIFASPFFSILRCEIYIKLDRSVPSLPLFLFETSPGSDSGKTFMLKIFLKMMTGLDILPMNYDDLSQRCGLGKNKQYPSISEYLRTVMNSGCGLPFFIDEINSQTLTKSIEPLLKNSESCEHRQNIGQPLLIFASNKMSNPEETERKRAVWFEFSGGLPSSVDRAEYQCKGDSLYRKCTTAFYREYLKRILPKIQEMLQYIEDEKPEQWYPDLILMSSDVIRSILTDNGYEVPAYMRELTWYNDFNGNECAAEEALSQILDMYNNNRKAFIMSRDTVCINLGSDSRSKKMLENWMRVLPKEMDPRNTSIRMDYQIKLNRQELESRLGFKLKKKFLSRLRHS